MENTTFPYDSKWETVTFAAPAKRIIVFQDVTEYQQRPIHDEYLNFLADLQKVNLQKSRTLSARKYQIRKIAHDSTSSNLILKHWSNC